MKLPALTSCVTRQGATDEALRSVERQVGRLLPDDYKDLLRASDGLEGFASEHSYVSLWPIAELPRLNEAYAVQEFAPGLLMIGTDGADTGYGFRGEGAALEYVAVPLVGMDPHSVSILGRSLSEFLESVAIRQ